MRRLNAHTGVRSRVRILMRGLAHVPCALALLLSRSLSERLHASILFFQRACMQPAWEGVEAGAASTQADAVVLCLTVAAWEGRGGGFCVSISDCTSSSTPSPSPEEQLAHRQQTPIYSCMCSSSFLPW